MSTHRRLDQADQDWAGKLANLNPGSGKLMQEVADCCALLLKVEEGAWLMKSLHMDRWTSGVWIGLGRNRTWAGRLAGHKRGRTDVFVIRKLMHGVVECCALLVEEGEGAWLMKSHDNQC
jgi:hypothetical protein